MKTEEFKFQIVTPMFLGGADQKAEGIRPASIKGALRFWWRALNWARCWQASGQNDVQALRLLHSEEARLFGLAAGWDEATKKTSGGQGVFLMQVAAVQTQKIEQPFSPMTHGQLYLLGMGLATFKEGGKCLRNALQRGGTFTLKLIFHPQAKDGDVQQVKDAVRAFGLLGALGSRARHGLGSVASVESAALNRAEYIKAVQDLLKPTLLASGEAPFTAFSARSRVDVSATGNDALKLLDAVGREQQLYRSFGRNGQIGHGPIHENRMVKVNPIFREDHDLIFNVIKGTPPNQAPKRVVFGLPHNYFFSSTKGKADVNYAPEGNDGRRASPLLLHMHPLGDAGFVAVHVLMPAQFLPAGGQIRIKVGASFNVPVAPDWQILRNYLNRFMDKGGETIHGK